MSKTAFKSIYLIIMSLSLVVSIAVPAGAVDKANVNDTVELKNGNKVTGTVLTDTFTITTPYSLVPVKKEQISEIEIASESRNHDVIMLNEGGSLEGMIEEPDISFKLDSGKIITLKKDQCKKIILKSKNE